MALAFRTIVKAAKPSFRITHEDRILTIGSCFSENIGRYFERYKFDICINPFGQQYNPFSIAMALKRLLNPQPYGTEDLIFRDELWHSQDHHGSFSRPSKQEALAGINSNLEQAAAYVKQASVLLLTFGTAHVFRRKDNGMVVSNCHKIPGACFDFELMPPEAIAAAIEEAMAGLLLLNPGLKVVLTVSPVRYFAFGHFENSVSKGHLFTAVYKLLQQHSNWYYFPAYELVIDDLRDYRFFAEDLLHPNYQATAYVWHALCQVLLPAAVQDLLKELDEIVAAANHRPRNPGSEAHRKFIEATQVRITKLEAQMGLDFSNERAKLMPV